MSAPITGPDGEPITGLRPEPPRGDAAAIQADIEQTRAELADTVDALSAKLDVRSQAAHKAQELGERATLKVEQAVAAAPEPVQQALGKAAATARPAVQRAAADPTRTAKVAGAVVVALLVLRRVSRARGRRRAAAAAAARAVLALDPVSGRSYVVEPVEVR